jgi:hypothetical protein
VRHVIPVDGLNSCPECVVVDNGLVYVLSDNGHVMAGKMRAGSLEWTAHLDNFRDPTAPAYQSQDPDRPVALRKRIVAPQLLSMMPLGLVATDGLGVWLVNLAGHSVRLWSSTPHCAMRSALVVVGSTHVAFLRETVSSRSVQCRWVLRCVACLDVYASPQWDCRL